jgi:hypothetical protein
MESETQESEEHRPEEIGEREGGLFGDGEGGQ